MTDRPSSTRIKVIQLIRKKSGMTREEFIEYYENKHAPLIIEHFPYMREYRRNYPIFDDPLTNGGRKTFAAESPFETNADFDVFSEGIFDSRADLEKILSAYMDQETQRLIAADEANFVAPNGVRRFIVEVRESAIP